MTRPRREIIRLKVYNAGHVEPRSGRPALALAGAMLALCACSQTQGASPTCPVAPLRPTPGPEAIDSLMEIWMRDALGGRAVPTPDDRHAARHRIAVACLDAHVDTIALNAPFAAAVDSATDGCKDVISRYMQAEAMEAVLNGGTPPGPGEAAAMRDDLRAVAATRLRDRRAGKCDR
jgi:hypothetical protein